MIARTNSFSACASIQNTPSSSNSSNGHTNNGNNNNDADSTKIKPILPLWMVAAICLFFLTAGFLQHQFDRGDDGTSSSAAAAAVRSASASQPYQKNSGNTGATAAHQQTRSLLLTPAQDAALERDGANADARYHVVFSTDCSPYQHWQSYLVFYTAIKVQQTGHVTRIASGCSPDEEVAMRKWFQQSVQVLSTRFHLHLTPKFSTILDDQGNILGDYKFFNKPFGLKHWMEHFDLLRFNPDTRHFPQAVHSDVVILIDPDMILLRPLTSDFSNPRETLYGPARQKLQPKLPDKVGPGQPFAQVYGFGTQWSRLDLEAIAGAGTPAALVSQDAGRLYYPAGPPYLATVSDMHRIAVSWSAFVAPTYAQYPHLLAEMFAYSIAAAHLELPHALLDSLMVSDVSAAGGEGWALVERIPPQQLCGLCQTSNNSNNNNNKLLHTSYAVPSVLHMCQRYVVGDEWFFTKRKIPSDIYDCDTPLFAEPPPDLAVKYDYKHAPGGKRFALSQQEAVRQSFMLCTIYAVLNEAAAQYKHNACSATTAAAVDTINLKKTRSLVQYMAAERKAKTATTTA